MTHVLGCPPGKPKNQIKYMRFGGLLGLFLGLLGPLGASWGLLGAADDLGGPLRAEGSKCQFEFPSWVPLGTLALLGSLGASWAALGPPGAVSWAVLGASCGVRETSGAILDRLGGFLEVVLAIWSRLLAVLDSFVAIW